MLENLLAYHCGPAVAVHPEDERYAHLVGKTVKVPFVDREIPIIADTYVEKDFAQRMPSLRIHRTDRIICYKSYNAAVSRVR